MSKLSNVMKSGVNVDSVVAKIQLKPKEMKKISAQMKEEGRLNVYPNKFDSTKPYRVAVRKDSTWENYGNFSSLEVAAAIGTIAGLYHYGETSLVGNFDAEKAENDPEFKAWMIADQNSEVSEFYDDNF